MTDEEMEDFPLPWEQEQQQQQQQQLPQQRSLRREISQRERQMLEDNRSNISPRRNSAAAQLLTSIREDSKLPLETRRGSLENGPMADLMRSLSKGKMRPSLSYLQDNQDMSIPRRRFTAYDLLAGANGDSPQGAPRRDAVALGIPSDMSVALATTSVTELLKPSSTQPAIVTEHPTPELAQSDPTQDLQSFRFGDAGSEDGDVKSPLELPKQEPNVPLSPSTPGGVSPKRSQSANVPKIETVHINPRSVSMLDFTSPRELNSRSAHSAGERLMKLRDTAGIVSPTAETFTLAAIPRHAASYIRHLKYLLSVDDEAACWVVLCAAVALADNGDEFGTIVCSEDGSDAEAGGPFLTLESLLANVCWAEEVARPHIEDLEKEVADGLFKDFVHGKDAVDKGLFETASAAASPARDVHSPARYMHSPARDVHSPGTEVSMVDAATWMVYDVAVDATVPLSDDGTADVQASPAKKRPKRKKKKTLKERSSDKHSTDSSPVQAWDVDHFVDGSLIGSLKNLEDKVNKVLEQTSPSSVKRQLPPLPLIDRSINLDLEPTELRGAGGNERSVNELAVNSKELWKGFLARGDHPKGLPPNRFVDYCSSLGYSKFEALCLTALWYNQDPQASEGQVSVIDDDGQLYGPHAHTYPVGNGASYTDLLPDSPLFKAVAREVVETCHSVSFMKSEMFKVVRVVEAHCNEEVTSAFIQAKGNSKVKILYYNPLKMKPFLNALIEGISSDLIFSSEAIIRKRPIKGQSLCLLLCEAAIGRCKAVSLKDPSNRSELQKVLRTSGTDTVSSTYTVRCMDGSTKVGRHYASKLGALPRFMVQVEVKESGSVVSRAVFKPVEEQGNQLPEVRRELVVECPEVEELAGVYTKVGMLRDMPIFGKDDCRLFTDSRQGWMFADTADGPERDEGIVTSVNAHNGKLPHSMKKWQCSNGEEWVRTQVVITERFADRFDNIRQPVPPPLPTVEGNKGMHSYTTPVTGYGLWEWVFRITYCTGKVGFGIGVGDYLYVDITAPADVTIRLGLKQKEATLMIYKINNKARSSSTKVIQLWAPTQLVFPQVDFPVEGSVRMLAPPRYMSTFDE
eukprot:TRINITY_DN1900_c0_g1_i3.p1 TRINITY_DN1900_c0_g1~~TRINITY_DN1900_c0_g1_i3.p1  ORF type:complete len:1228 (+),score=278.43 TRINITY_DN1900_c0_g1_i3:433-3684(+)